MTTPAIDPTAPAVAPAAPAATAAPAVAAPVAPALPVVDDPAWLPARLAKKEASLLKELGVDSLEVAKAKIAEANAAAAAKQTLEERYASTNTALTQAQTEAVELRQTIAQRVAFEMKTLTPEQKAAVEAAAGENPSAQLRVIDALRPTWVLAAPIAPAPSPAKPIPAPGATAPAGTPPAPAPSGGDVNHLATYDQMMTTNPVRAARYLVQHHAEITRARNATA